MHPSPSLSASLPPSLPHPLSYQFTRCRDHRTVPEWLKSCSRTQAQTQINKNFPRMIHFLTLERRKSLVSDLLSMQSMSSLSFLFSVPSSSGSSPTPQVLKSYLLSVLLPSLLFIFSKDTVTDWLLYLQLNSLINLNIFIQFMFLPVQWCYLVN